jgi:hypothetical protein
VLCMKDHLLIAALADDGCERQLMASRGHCPPRPGRWKR